MVERLKTLPPREELNAVTDKFVATAKRIAKDHGITTEDDSFDGPFATPIRQVNITTPGVPDNFKMVQARVRIERDYYRALTADELRKMEEDEAKAKRSHIPPPLREKPTKKDIGTLNKEGYLIEVSTNGGYEWNVVLAVKTVFVGEPVKINNAEIKKTLRARELRLETLEKIGEALDLQAKQRA
ncbi:MAG: hypothetical protein ABIC96_04060 [Patescibacteria group bacterium]